MIQQFPTLMEKIEDFDATTLKIPASIQIRGDKICFFDDFFVSIKIGAIKKLSQSMTFSGILKELDNLLDLKGITYRKDELIDILYEVLRGD